MRIGGLGLLDDEGLLLPTSLLRPQLLGPGSHVTGLYYPKDIPGRSWSLEPELLLQEIMTAAEDDDLTFRSWIEQGRYGFLADETNCLEPRDLPDLLLTSIPYELWNRVVSFEVLLLHKPGAMEAVAEQFKQHGWCILSADCTRSSHRYATWTLVCAYEGTHAVAVVNGTTTIQPTLASPVIKLRGKSTRAETNAPFGWELEVKVARQATEFVNLPSAIERLRSLTLDEVIGGFSTTIQGDDVDFAIRLVSEFFLRDGHFKREFWSVWVRAWYQACVYSEAVKMNSAKVYDQLKNWVANDRQVSEPWLRIYPNYDLVFFRAMCNVAREGFPDEPRTAYDRNLYRPFRMRLDRNGRFVGGDGLANVLRIVTAEKCGDRPLTQALLLAESDSEHSIIRVCIVPSYRRRAFGRLSIRYSVPCKPKEKRYSSRGLLVSILKQLPPTINLWQVSNQVIMQSANLEEGLINFIFEDEILSGEFERSRPADVEVQDARSSGAFHGLEETLLMQFGHVGREQEGSLLQYVTEVAATRITAGGVRNKIQREYEPYRRFTAFISYSSKDEPNLLRLKQDLQGEEFSIRMMETDAAEVSKSFEDSLWESLRQSIALVVVWSNNAKDRDWVKLEVGGAKALGIPIYVVWMNCEKGSGPHWLATMQGCSASDNFDDLIEFLRRAEAKFR
jgi:hypothetical protein